MKAGRLSKEERDRIVELAERKLNAGQIAMRMRRHLCLQWLEERQYPRPPKSACTFCPFHTNAMWREIRDGDPAAWAQAIEVDEGLRLGTRAKGLRSLAFVHRTLVPLAEAAIDEPDVPGFDFDNECEGMCGV